MKKTYRLAEALILKFGFVRMIKRFASVMVDTLIEDEE